MIALIQRVSQAQVAIHGQTVGAIGAGLLVLLCAERGDTEAEGERLLNKLLSYRVFNDAQGKMNLPVTNLDGAGQHGGLLIVSQFTLAADTRSGTRPSFTPAAAPEDGKRLYADFVARAKKIHPLVQSGEFGADMQVSLTNDGPVTFWLQVNAKA